MLAFDTWFDVEAASCFVILTVGAESGKFYMSSHESGHITVQTK